MKQKLKSKLQGEIAICRYAEDATLMTESKEEIESLMKVKEESEKAGLKLNIQKTKNMASSPITSWQIDGETMTDFIFLGSKITVENDCSHEIERCLLLERIAMTNLDSVLKKQRYHFADIGPYSQSHMVFPIVMYGCESWTIKKTECQRMDALNCGVGEDS